MSDTAAEPGLGLPPTTTALIIMDVQPSVLSRLPDPDAYLGGVVRARQAARSAGMHVAYVRVALTQEDAARVPKTNMRFFSIAQSSGLRDGNVEFDVDERIAPGADEIVVRKSRIGAFSTTDLNEQLRAAGIDTVVLGGISTSGVVLSTVRDAADRDYRIVVLSDGCFDGDPEVHRVLTQKVFPRQATVVTITEFVDALG